jgi:hypothetical protein
VGKGGKSKKFEISESTTFERGLSARPDQQHLYPSESFKKSGRPENASLYLSISTGENKLDIEFHLLEEIENFLMIFEVLLAQMKFDNGKDS